MGMCVIAFGILIEGVSAFGGCSAFGGGPLAFGGTSYRNLSMRGRGDRALVCSLLPRLSLPNGHATFGRVTLGTCTLGVGLGTCVVACEGATTPTGGLI